MRKKIVLRLSVLIVFLTVLWSCHNEDFAKGGTEPQRNNANFFKHTQKGGINAKSGVDYVSILEAYNREKDFLTSMPDQQGMPIWDKMQIVDTENTTGLTIPLSHDGETLSSLLFVILDAQNTVEGVKDMTNMDLETIVYNKNYAAAEREGLMNTFIMMDYHTFGNKLFGNIPEDLYEGHKIEDQNNRLLYEGSQGGDEKSIVKYNAQGKMLYIATTTCTTTWHCKNDLAISNCDGCSKCKSTSCSTTYSPIYIEDDSGFPTWNGDGGGGGGTPGPGGIPPKDPCSMSLQVFYRLNPGCAGGGNIDIPIDDPCEKTKSMLQDPKVQLAIDDVTKQAKKAALDVNEGEIGRIEKNGMFYVADVSEDHHVIFNDISGAKGAYHNHTYKGAKIHSPEDIFSILGFAQVQPTVANYGDAYIGMIGAEKCYPDVPACFRMFHYIIRFSGITADLSKNFTEDEMKELEKAFRNREYILREKLPYTDFLGDITLNKKGYEKLFFETLNNMDLSGKVILQRVDDDGIIYNINLDVNGMPEATPCPL